MEGLPLELHDQIFGYLLPPHRDWTNIVAVPVSTPTERSDVYNLRLVSRRVNRAAVHPFVQIIGEIPTKCTTESLHSLAKLLNSANVANDVTCLSLDVCKLFITEKKTLSQLITLCENRNEWIKTSMGNEVLAVLRQTPQLRHLVFLPGVVRGSDILDFKETQRIQLERNVREIPDPILCVQHALKSTGLHENVETMAILQMSLTDLIEETLAKHEVLSVKYPLLKHLTISPLYSEVSGFRVHSPNLTSLHIILDNRGDAFDTGSAEFLPVDNIQPGLQSLVLSGDSSHVNTALLIQCIVPATTKIKTLPSLIIRDMTIIMDINWGIEQLPGEGRVNELLFENVTYCFTDEITLSGPSEPTEINKRWRALPRLCERADRVCLKNDGVERLLEPFEWEDHEEDI